MVSLHTGRFVVVHQYSTFFVDHQNFPLGANLYQNYHFSRFWGLYKPTFLKATTVKFDKGGNLGLPPQAKFCIKIA